MTTTSVTTVGGVVIVTQVIPQDDPSIPLQTSPTTTAAQTAPPPAAKAPPPAPPTKLDDMTATFLRGQPHGLGVVQIVIGLMCVLFSLSAILSPRLLNHAPFCSGIVFVVSGSLTVAAGRHTTVAQVGACLASGVISALLSLGGVAYLGWLLATPLYLQLCDADTFKDPDAREQCRGHIRRLPIIMYGLQSTVLVLLVLQFCVSVTACVFSGKTLGRRGLAPPVMVRVDDVSDVALLDDHQ